MKSKIKRKITFKGNQMVNFNNMFDEFLIINPYCHTMDSVSLFLETLKNIDKPVFENECYITIESED